MSIGDLSTSELFFDFSLQRFKVLIIQIFHFLSYSHAKVFYIICDYCEWCCFPNFLLSLFIACDLFELILYPATALKLFIRFRSSLVEFLGSLIYYHIMMNDHFDVFLDSVSENFLEYFCIDIHNGNWSEVLFLCWFFVWFRYQSNS